MMVDQKCSNRVDGEVRVTLLLMINWLLWCVDRWAFLGEIYTFKSDNDKSMNVCIFHLILKFLISTSLSIEIKLQYILLFLSSPMVYRNSSEAYGNGEYGRMSGPVWLDYVKCNGTETSIEECSHSTWGTYKCDYNHIYINCLPPKGQPFFTFHCQLNQVILSQYL